MLIQVLSITCDNASANDSMIDEIAITVPRFSGAPNHTRCFNHTVALVAKRVVRQFDMPKKGENDDMSDEEAHLQELAEGIEDEEAITQQEGTGSAMRHDGDNGDDNDNGDDDDNENDMVDEELEEESLWPVRMLLVKVSTWFVDGFIHSPDLCSFAKLPLRLSTQARFSYQCGLRR